MAIIIPSKDIYEINNQKVVDNEVDNIEVSVKNIAPKNDYNATVYDGQFDTENNYTNDVSDRAFGYQFDDSTNVALEYSFVYGEGIINPYYFSGTVKVPRKHFDYIVSSINGGRDKEGNANINYTVACEKIEATEVTATYNGSNFENINITYPKEAGETKEYELPKSINVYQKHTAFWSDSKVDFEVNLSDKTNLASIGNSIKIQETEDEFIFDFNVLCGEELIALVTEGEKRNESNIPALTYTGVTRAEKYIPKSITITVYGNTIGIDLQDETVKIGDGQHVYSFEGNELMQSNPQKMTYGISVGRQIGSSADASIRYYLYSHDEFLEDLIEGDILKAENGDTAEVVSFSSYGLVLKTNANSEFANMSLVPATMIVTRTTKSATTLAYTKVLHEWQSGKEVATIKCAIDKYGENIDPATSNMTFHIGDTVIPYVMGADGHDKPMSLYADKTPKEFNVIGKGIIADGEIMQELTLQEIPKNE